jgi:hypothetical protein
MGDSHRREAQEMHAEVYLKYVSLDRDAVLPGYGHLR